MLKKISTTLFFFLSVLSFAQITEFKAPSYDQIEKNTQDRSSEFYYPPLLKKLQTGNDSLSASEYEHLYFGYVFQPTYKPYGVFSKDKELQVYYQKDPDPKDIPALKILLKEALDEFPFDFTAMMFLSYIYHLEGDEDKSALLSKHFEGFAKAITTSGDGLTCETAMHVISISHEYHMLQLFDIENTSQSFDGTCDFLALDPEYYNIAGLYFNVSQLQKKE